MLPDLACRKTNGYTQAIVRCSIDKLVLLLYSLNQPCYFIPVLWKLCISRYRPSTLCVCLGAFDRLSHHFFDLPATWDLKKHKSSSHQFAFLTRICGSVLWRMRSLQLIVYLQSTRLPRWLPQNPPTPSLPMAASQSQLNRKWSVCGMGCLCSSH